MSDFERITEIQMPYDKRHPDPSKNYGIHGMTLRFVLKGELGATQFVFYTGQYLPHVAEEFWRKHDGYNPFKGMGADIGLHSPKPIYEGQTPMDCHLLEGGKCYYDGSSLQAQEFESEFFSGGTDAIWKMLEGRYNLWLVK